MDTQDRIVITAIAVLGTLLLVVSLVEYLRCAT